MMTETITRVQLTELKTVRIVCRKEGCKGVVELPLEDMATSGVDRCPVCHTVYSEYFPPGRQLFAQFAELVGTLNKIRSMSLEFPIPSQP
jgi:hypothetical protein